IIVHKADGDNLRLAKRTVREYKQILHLLQPATPGWSSTSLAVSSYQNTVHDEVRQLIFDFKEKMQSSNFWEELRQEQAKSWFHDMIRDHLIESFFSQSEKREKVDELEESLLKGEVTIAGAVKELFTEK